MTEKIVQAQIKVCDCGSELIPGMYPEHRFSEPDENGIQFVSGVIPAWFCPNCGEHNLVKKEEMTDWLFTGIRFQRAIVGTINVSNELSDLCPKFQAMLQEQNGDCIGCGECELDPEEQEDGEEEVTAPGKRNLH